MWHRYVLGLYEVLERITKKFPNVWIEGCAGGGGRFDLGMLYYQPLIWISDNTDPYGRAAIHYGASLAYPMRVMSYHISKDEGYTGKRSDAEFRFLVSRFGGIGYEFDLTVLSDEQISEYRALLSEREYTVLCMRYALTGGAPKAQREVAAKLNISRSYVSRIEKRAIARLKKRLSASDFYDAESRF